MELNYVRKERQKLIMFGLKILSRKLGTTLLSLIDLLQYPDFLINSLKIQSLIRTLQCPKICCQVQELLEKFLCGHINFESS